jgi:hypothetical protein
MATDDLLIGTRTGVYGSGAPISLSQPDRLRHTYLIGQTGTGKSTLLKHLILQDIHAGRGCALLDPHGDLARDILEHIPPTRSDDLVYFNPSDRDHVPALNLLSGVPPEARDRTASEIVSTFRYLWTDTWGRGRMQYVFKNTVAALLDFPEDPGTSLLGIPRMYADSDYRRRIIKHIRNENVRRFWEIEYASYPKSFEVEAISPIQNKVGQFLLSTTLANILGQVKSTIDLSFVMNTKRIFLANLSKGELGEDDANLLGSLILTAFYLAALKRTKTPEHERVPFHLYIDEFASFTTGAFTTILSEARKFGLSLTLAHQYLDQIDPGIKSAVLGNVGTMILFRTGSGDAEELAHHFEGIPPHFFAELATGNIVAKTLARGEPTVATGKTMTDAFPHYGRGTRLVAHSQNRHTRPMLAINSHLMRESDSSIACRPCRHSTLSGPLRRPSGAEALAQRRTSCT